MKKQVQAVIEVVSSVTDVVQGVPTTLTKEQKECVVNELVEGFKNNEIELKTTFETDAKLRAYTGGLVNNWLRKSPILNGGSKYEAKNPGSRSGSPEFKQANALKAALIAKGSEAPAELEAFIEANRPQPKSMTKEIDLSSLPESLRSLAS